MTQPTQNAQALPVPMPDVVADYLLRMAKQRMAGTAATRSTRLLWSCAFPLPGVDGDVVIELLPSLVLRIRNRSTGEILAQTVPVEVGPRAPQARTVEECFLAWCESRKAEAATPADTSAPPVGAPHDQQPPAEGPAA